MNPLSLPNSASVVLEQVVKRYNPKGPAAVDNVSLRFEAGSLTTLLGPSGCGKTTTLRMIAGLETATSGRILIGDKDVTRLPATERDVSMVFQSYALFPHMRVSENIRYGLEVSRIPRDVMEAKTREVMKLMGLETLGQRYPHELSGGQQQRVAVARALVLEPMVLLFDEPLSNLDAKLRRRVRQEIRELQQSLKLTVIYVTHDQEEALAVSDTIVVMNNAVVAQMGSPRELHERPTSRFVADFIGEANVLPCQILDSGPDGTRVQLGKLQLTLEGQTPRRGAGHVAVRPGRIALHAQTAGVQTALLEATLAKSSYLGEYFEHTLQTELGEVLVASGNTTEQLSPGQLVGLGFNPDTVVLLQD